MTIEELNKLYEELMEKTQALPKNYAKQVAISLLEQWYRACSQSLKDGTTSVQKAAERGFREAMEGK